MFLGGVFWCSLIFLVVWTGESWWSLFGNLSLSLVGFLGFAWVVYCLSCSVGG